MTAVEPIAVAKISDRDFGASEFALGSIRGYRSWRVDIEGKLSPLHQDGKWLPGENSAVCLAYPSKDVVPQIEGEGYAERNARAEAWRADHVYSECTHGFYAYFGGQESQYRHELAVDGVIEGYGDVLVGSKGFRCMKARILALSVEGHEGVWALEPYVIDRIRKNYPGVEVFDSSFAMLAAFPADAAVKFQDAA